MCGIAGVVDLRGLDAAALRPGMDAALERLAPRGPDGDGVWADGRCMLGHRRLAVIDLSDAAAQPMHRHGRVVTYNGEIYNFEALRRELEAAGTVFQSQSDTEVLLAGWAYWGAGLLDRLVGMFAFALWDPARGELVLARDRFGKKPLLFAQDGARVYFASDLTALRRLGGGTGTIDHQALRLLFAFGWMPEPWSIDLGVRKLPAGHMAVFSARQLTVARWYQPPATEPYDSERSAEFDLRRALDAAVKDRLVADVPVGAFLSGGIDSAIVAASLAAQGSLVRTFTVGFRDAADYYEERPAARVVAEHLGLEHVEIEVGPDDARAALDAVFDGLDEPFADSSAVPTWLLCRETRRYVTVALSGDGADEVFGGYRKYQGELYAAAYQRVPRAVRNGMVRPLARRLPQGKQRSWTERARRMGRFVEHAGGAPADRQAGWACQLTEDDLDALLHRRERTGDTTAGSLVDVLRRDIGEADPINLMLATDLRLVLPGDMLVKVDRMSMANSLEVRCPFLDHRVVECAAAMPGDFKLRRGTGKRILRHAFADRLPAEVFGRPKKGFEVPVAQWLVHELRDLTRAAIDPVRLQRQGLFQPELPQRWFADLEQGRRDTAGPLWTLVAFQAWADRQPHMDTGF